jgi:hypothetical protein
MGQKWRTGSDGVLELVDEETGQIIEREKRKAVLRKDGTIGRGRGGRKTNNATHHWITDGDGKKFYVPIGTNPDHLPHTKYPYCRVTCEQVCALIMTGLTMEDVGKEKGFPPAYILRTWKMKHPEFKADIENAEKARADYLADQTIIIAREATRKTVQQDRLKIDTYLSNAEFGNREHYGKQTKISGDPNAPLGWIIDTGIRLEESPPILTEGKRLPEESE